MSWFCYFTNIKLVKEGFVVSFKDRKRKTCIMLLTKTGKIGEVKTKSTENRVRRQAGKQIRHKMGKWL